jgi:hypothetical protein
MTIGTCPLSRSLLGVKRTLVGALHMSAFDRRHVRTGASSRASFLMELCPQHQSAGNVGRL